MKREVIRDRNRHTFAIASCLVALIGLFGCATPEPRAIPAFRQGVITASQQTTAAFTDINNMLREQQLDRAARQPSLTEEHFAEGIPADARATWMRAFRLMDEYAAKLEQLLGPEQRAGLEAELRSFGEKLTAVREEPLPAGVGAGFVKLGGFLIQMKAGKDALVAMRSVDPAIQEIFATMSDAIGASNDEGVRLTVRSAWTRELGRLQVEFVRARDESAKRRVAGRFLNMLGERDAHDQLLNSLRISFLSLASAHAAMAAGNAPSASAFITIVQDEYKSLREEIERLREDRIKEP